MARTKQYAVKEEKSFTFLWKIENVSFCLQKKGEEIKSPTFVVNEINQTKWNLTLYRSGASDSECIQFSLMTDIVDNDTTVVEIKYEIALIGIDDSPLIIKTIGKGAFRKGQGCSFQIPKDNFNALRSTLLPPDTLTVRCRIWKIVGEMSEEILCSAFTRIEVEKRYLKWNVKNFSTLQPGKKCSYQIKSIPNDAPLMSVSLSVTGSLSSEEIIRFEFFPHDETIKFATLRLFLIDASGNRIKCNEEDICLDDSDRFKPLTFSITKDKLLEEKSVYLLNDTLSLLFYWTFSRGVESEKTEKNEHKCIGHEIKVSDAQNANNDKISRLGFLVENMKSLYDELFLSDVKLKSNTREFPAHKFILSASSSVFKRMFSTDMIENESGCVNIEDLSDDTIRGMLLFMYTTRVEDLTYERAFNLYVAANKYAILSLKNICSSYLEDNLSPSNACEVLVLSDLHADHDLKVVVQYYIVKHGRQVTHSDGWSNLIETNAKLAAETLGLLFK